MFGTAVSFRLGDCRFESFLILGDFSIDELSQPTDLNREALVIQSWFLVQVLAAKQVRIKTSSDAAATNDGVTTKRRF